MADHDPCRVELAAARATARVAAPASSTRSARDRRAGRLARWFVFLELAFEIRRERRMLAGMDERSLKDIGFSRGDAYAESRRSFWDVPRIRLLK